MATSVDRREYNYLPNILEAAYANYSYIIQFAMVNPKNLRDTNSVENNGIIIAQTGVTSKFQIENLNIENYVGWNKTSRSAQALQGTIDIYEPLGLNYYDAIFAASQQLGIPNHLRAGYVLTVTFQGQEEKGAYYGNVPSYRWPILVTGVRSIPTEHGTSHSIDFASVTNSAFDSFTEKVSQQVTITGVKTFNDFIDKFQQVLNKHQKEKELVTIVYPDEYILDIKDLSADTSLGQPVAKNYEFAVDKYKSTNKLQIEYKSGSGHDFTIPAGSLISEVISLAYMNTDEAQKAVTTTQKQGAKTQANDEATISSQSGLPMFFKVDGDVEFLEYDNWRNEYQKRIYYTLNPTIEVGILFDGNNYNDHIVDQTYQLKRLQEMQKYFLLRKRYDYWYTGRNTSILNFNFELNNAWVALQPIDRGVVNNPGTNLGTQELSGKLEIDQERKNLDDLQKLIAENNNLTNQLAKAKKADNYDGQNSNSLEQRILQNKNRIEKKRQEIISLRGNPPVSTLTGDTSETNNPEVATKQSRVKAPKYVEEFFYNQNTNLPSDIPVRWKEMDLSSYTGFLPAGELNASNVMMGAVYANLIGEKSLVKINLDIIGDPYWFGFTPNFLSSSAFNANDTLRNLYADYKKGSNLFYFTINLPKETLYGDPTAIQTDRNVSVVQGLYQVIKVNSTFTNGQFTQSLEAIKDVNTNSRYIESIIVE